MSQPGRTICYLIAGGVAILFSLCVIIAAIMSYLICLPLKIFHKA